MRKIEKIKLLPIIIVWGFVPLLVRMQPYQTGLSQFEWYPDSSEWQTDFFLVWKSWFITACAICMLLILAYNYFERKREMRVEWPFYLVLAYGVLVFLSGLLSGNSSFAFRGGYEIYESVWVLLSYCIIIYYTYQYVRTQEDVVRLIEFTAIGVGIQCVVGVSQLVGMDVFRTTIGKMLITPPSQWSELDTLSFRFPPHVVYSTLYNVDYLGYYVGIFLPIMIVMLLFAGKIWKKVVYAVLSVALVLCLIGAGALGGAIAVIVGGIVGSVVLISRNKKWLLPGIASGACCAILFVIVCLNTSLGEKLYTVFVGTTKGYDAFAVKAIETNDEDVVFDINGERLHIRYMIDDATGGVYVACSDETGNDLDTQLTGENHSIYEILDDRFDCVTVEPAYVSEYIGISVVADGVEWNFTNQVDGTYYYANPIGKFVKMEPVETVNVFNNDAFQNRGVIWNHTIPHLKEHILLGSGANTFVLVYPQNDYIYKTYMNMATMFDVKAHNWYLQQWIENGLLALLCILAFYGIYFVRSVKLYRRITFKHNMSAYMGFAVFIGINSYMISSIVNDSYVCTAPVLWCAFGLGYALNRMNAEYLKKEQKGENK